MGPFSASESVSEEPEENEGGPSREKSSIEAASEAEGEMRKEGEGGGTPSSALAETRVDDGAVSCAANVLSERRVGRLGVDFECKFECKPGGMGFGGGPIRDDMVTFLYDPEKSPARVFVV